MGITFNRQMNTARALFGKQLKIPQFTWKEITAELKPMLEFYAERDRGLITERVVECILERQMFNK